MTHFASIANKINLWSENLDGPMFISGANSNQWSLIFSHLISEHANKLLNKNQLLVFSDEDSAENFYTYITSFSTNLNFLFYPGLDASPYSGTIGSESDYYQRLIATFFVDHFQTNSTKFILITSVEALFLKFFDQKFLIDNYFKIQKDEIISPDELSNKLVMLGYSSASSVEEPGTFVKKGQIFDIYPVGFEPIRLTYFDDLIEEINLIDRSNQKTLKESKLDFHVILPGALIFTKNSFPITLRENIPQVSPGFKEKFELRKRILQHLSDGQLFESFATYIPLFFKQPLSLFERVNLESTLVSFIGSHEIERSFWDLKEELNKDYLFLQENIESDCLLPAPAEIYNFNFPPKLNTQKILHVNLINLFEFEVSSQIDINLNLISSKTYLNEKIGPQISRPDFIKHSLEYIKKSFEFSGHIQISTSSQNSVDEFKHLLNQLNFSPNLIERISFSLGRFSEGFFYEAEKSLFLTDGDFFSSKKSKVSKSKPVDIDLFAEQLATLKVGDFIIHSEFGLGKYLGLESLDVAGDKSDFLLIQYSDNDKVYVPVYKLNLIQKHADANFELKVDSLRNNKFQALKARARISAKTLAFDLLKLQAERQSSEAYAFSSPDHLYKEFELAFPFDETPDQTRAIEQVLECMQKPTPMDFLVCGDVGFGKTEIAMRAAFKAVEDKKQVAVLVPTTILALQHFNSFTKRFNDFPVKIEFISRFKSASESKAILENTKNGNVDILIGTHKLLSDKLQFRDLGLVIVDEEQRFGVGHKEKLKLMKSSVDFLTLTATPIPRTLQMAFLGLRDLSLIKTSPPKRQSIKTYVIKDDRKTIQNAITKELARGGQVFIVHNKVQDIEEYTGLIRELVPTASIIFAHGQMPERELEDRINAFYSGKYQILISTTIIESGIDIPNANTMIIDRADTFGLAQLHQLRGRIGRSDKKAYAYFIIPNGKLLSSIAEKRLHALQTYAEMGAGFNLASVDLEIRGAGDILGASQSGHIEAIGLELYMELLKDAISELKGESKVIKKDIEISTPFNAFIPNHYIKDPSERLKQYKRLSNCESLELLLSIQDELLDVYGLFSEELKNLFLILEVRISLQYLGLKSLQVAGSAIILKFDRPFLESNTKLRDQIVSFFISRPKVYQFTPDYKLIFNGKGNINQSELLRFAKEISEQIVLKM